MGQYFKIVNVTKKQYIDLCEISGCKFSSLSNNLTGIIISRLLCSFNSDISTSEFINSVGNPEKDELYLGAWINDKIIIAGDYMKPNSYFISTSNSQNGDRNLFLLAEEEYEDITVKVIIWLAKDESLHEEIASTIDSSKLKLFYSMTKSFNLKKILEEFP